MSQKRRLRKLARRDRRRKVGEPLWVTLGLDVCKCELVLMGLATTEEEALTQHDRWPDAGYVRSWHTRDMTGNRLFDWFRSCGATEEQAIELIRLTGSGIATMVDEIAEEKGWIEPKILSRKERNDCTAG